MRLPADVEYQLKVLKTEIEQRFNQKNRPTANVLYLTEEEKRLIEAYATSWLSAWEKQPMRIEIVETVADRVGFDGSLVKYKANGWKTVTDTKRHDGGTFQQTIITIEEPEHLDSGVVRFWMHPTNRYTFIPVHMILNMVSFPVFIDEDNNVHELDAEGRKRKKTETEGEN